MECNREDALRATELAEKKLAVRDLAGAKKFALKATRLFPGLDRAKQMLLVVEVHAAAELKCDDWYGILQIDPVADVDSIKKQFRKLALQLHPDKNNLQGAEQAFKLINEAWGVLSDKVQRAVYDVKRNATAAESKPAADANGYKHGSAASADAAKVPQQEQPSAGRQQESVPPPFGRQQPPPRQGPISSKGGSSAATSSSQGPTTSSAQAQDTFWTQCPRCRVQYQYYRTYENYQLLCQRCKEGFVAKDMNVPALARGKEKQQESDPPRGSRVKSRVNSVKGEDFIQLMQQKAREREEKRLEDERRKMEKEKKREEKRRLKEALKKFKEEEKRREAMERQMQKQREREEKEARKKSMEALKKKLKRSRMQEEDDDDDDDEEEEEEEEVGAAQAAALGLRRSYRTRKNVVYRDDIFDEDGQAAKKARSEELNLSEEELAFRKHLAEKGRQYVLKALSVMLKNEYEKAAAAEVLKEEQEVQVTQKEACPVAEVKPKTTPAAEVKAKATAAAEETPSACIQNQTCSELPQSTSSDESASDAVFFVPDSDFYDFDKDRREEDVQERQIWALYDDADGMPRFYCEIKQVVSRTPFKLRIRWLEHHHASEVEQKWQEAGFQMTCGRFKLAKRANSEDQINKFSHALASKIQGNFVRVYPVKGEVWALYRGWSTEWLQQGIDAEAASRGGYEMVEVVGDSSWAAAASAGAAEGAEEEREEMFVTVVSLVKVDGYRTIFARGQGAERTFKRPELLRFSHRVPAHWMTGEEKPNAPKDCWQLDTAAMPSHLINEAGD